MRDDQVEKMEKLAEEVADDFIITTCAAINTTIADKQGRLECADVVMDVFEGEGDVLGVVLIVDPDLSVLRRSWHP